MVALSGIPVCLLLEPLSLQDALQALVFRGGVVARVCRRDTGVREAGCNHTYSGPVC